MEEVLEALKYSKEELLTDDEKRHKAERAMSAYTKMINSKEYQKSMKRYL